MTARRVLQPARLLWLAPALLGLLASPAPARAGCGDHARPTASTFGDLLAALDSPTRPLLGPGEAPSPASPRPCTGPSCSGRREAAPLATPPAPRIAPGRGLVAPRVVPPHTPGSRTALALPTAAYQPPALDRHDRPPRA